MTPRQDPSVNELFQAALGMEPHLREAWLAAKCPNDPSLRARVARQLACKRLTGW
jgi:hypothetical protein